MGNSEFPIIDVLRLIRSENVGPVTFMQLMRRYKVPAEALAAIPDMAMKGGRKKPIQVMNRDDAEREITETYKYGAKMVSYYDADYPTLLKEIHDPPPIITYQGAMETWKDRELVGIVGVRNASANGCLFAHKIASDLGKAGYVISSGLAKGIDASAHKGSLDSGTVAVIAGGINTSYPPENVKLQEAIIEKGVVITEQAFGAAPHPQKFISRNRIISGLALGVVVVEAPVQSGSLATANFALDQGRDIFSVPGSPLDPRCKGSNNLLRQGAILTESAQDVIEHLRSLHSSRLRDSSHSLYNAGEENIPQDAQTLNEAREIILEKLSTSPVLVDELIVQCQLTPGLLLHVLLELELAGRLIRSPGNRVAIRVVNI